MEYVLEIINLAFQYLRRHFRRYLFLLTALAFGFGVITVITSLKEGMSRSVYRSAQSHYAGDLVVAGYDRTTNMKFRIPQPEQVLRAVEESGIREKQIVQRTHFGVKGELFFNGRSLRQKYVLGVDWPAEEGLLRSFTYTAGGYDQITGQKDILLSRPTAEKLGAALGDRVLLGVETLQGQKNTGWFRVRGIIKNTSIFGYYKSYVDRRELNQLLQMPPEQCSTVGIYLKNPDRMDTAAPRLRDALAQRLPTGPLVADRQDLERESSRFEGDFRNLVITLPVYLSEVADLLGAIEIIAYFLYALMVIIILVSVLVTYRLILFERRRELATLRALGFGGGQIRAILVTEAAFLLFLSLGVGALAAAAALGGVAQLSFSWIPSFQIFMRGGSLVPRFTVETVGRNILVMAAALFPAVWITSFQEVRRPIPQVLNGGKS